MVATMTTTEEREPLLTPGRAALYLGVSEDTLKRWEKAGRITPRRTPSGARRYTYEELDALTVRPGAA